MAQLLVDGTDLVVHLTVREKIAGFHGDIRVPLLTIRSTSVPEYPWVSLRGWRMAGFALAGKIAVGTRRHGSGYDFTCVHNQERAVQIDVSSGRFSRLVISCSGQHGRPGGGGPHRRCGRHRPLQAPNERHRLKRGPALLQAPGQVPALGLGSSQPESHFVSRRGVPRPVQPPQQIGPGGVQQVVSRQPPGTVDLVDQPQPGSRSLGHGYRHGPVELYDGRGNQANSSPYRVEISIQSVSAGWAAVAWQAAMAACS